MKRVHLGFLFLDADQVETIVKALQDFHSSTCIRFVPRDTQRMYLNFEPRYGSV